MGDVRKGRSVRRIALLLLVGCLLALDGGVASGAARPRGLRVVGAPSTIAVEFGPVTGTPAKGYRRRGYFALLLRNPDRLALRPRLTLDPAKSAPVLRLHILAHTPSTSVPRSAELRHSGGVPTIAPGSVGRLAAEVEIPAARDPASLDGTLVLNSVRRSLRLRGAPRLLALKATGLDLSDVTVVPRALTLHTTRWLPWPSGSGDVADFELRGVGAEALLEGRRRLDGRAVLHDGSGESVTVQVFLRERPGTGPQPAVRVLGSPTPGTYTGTLPIGTDAAAPSLNISVIAHDGIICALIAVGLGTFLGGLVPLLGARARKRSILLAGLESSLKRYKAVDRRDQIMEWIDLKEEIGEDPKPWRAREATPEPSLTGAAGLFSAIRLAQNDADFKSAEEAAEKMREGVGCWLKLQPKVKALEQVRSEPMPEIQGKSWSDTGLAHDSQLLAIDVLNNKPTPAIAASWAEAVQRQTDWHRQVAAAWQQLAATSLDPAEMTQRLGELEAVAAGGRAQRSSGEWTLLRGKLESFLLSLAAKRGGTLSATAPMVAFIEPLAVPTPSMTVGTRTTRLLAMTASGLERARVWLADHLLPGSRAGRRILAVQWRDIGLTIIAAVGAVLVYVLPVYNDTWGSLTDYLTAFAAGFGAQAIVRWSAQPIFQGWGKAPPAPANV